MNLSFQEICAVLMEPMPRSFLFTHWEGGGNTPPMLAIVRRLVARGHKVRVLSDACNHAEVEAVGASFAPWKRIPPRSDKSAASDPIKDWEVKSPVALIARMRDRLFVGPSLAFAQDLLEEIGRFPADVVVTSDMLLGVMAAAESAGLPCVAVSANIYMYPRRGVPPFGPGLQPTNWPLGHLRDALIRSFSLSIFGKGTKGFNATRRALGLPPLGHPFQQLRSLSKHLVLTSRAFDFPSASLPEHVLYTGPEIDDPAWVETWSSPWRDNDPRPLILVSFSTTFQNQVRALRRVVAALSTLKVRSVVTVGPALKLEDLPQAEHIFVCRSAPHISLLPHAAAVITHAGHGTVIRSLAAGVPLLCMPMGRDQNDNAARVVARGAGLKVKPTASVSTIQKALLHILQSPRYGLGAEQLGKRITEDARHSSTVPILEEVASLKGTRPVRDPEVIGRGDHTQLVESN